MSRPSRSFRLWAAVGAFAAFLLTVAVAAVPRLQDRTAGRTDAVGNNVEFGVFFAVGDVDGDCDRDVVSFISNSTTGSVLVNHGAESFVSEPARLPALGGAGRTTHPPTLADLDGDGDLDVVVGKYTAVVGTLNYLLNDGAGVFTDVTAARLPAVTGYFNQPVAADFDGDGDRDLFLPCGRAVPDSTGQDRLYLNDGAGAFSDATAGRIPVVSDLSKGAAAGDLDGDGDLDLVVTVRFGRNKVLINGGGASFTDQTAARWPAGNTNGAYACLLLDADRDSDLDVFMPTQGGAGSESEPDRLYLNDGAGVFSDATAAKLPGVSTWASWASAGDVDGDGFPEVISSHNPASPPKMFTFGPGGVATDTTANALANVPAGVAGLGDVNAIADLDGDGDLDVLLARNDNGALLYFRNPAGANAAPATPSGAREISGRDAGGGRARLSFRPSALPVSQIFAYQILSDSGTGTVLETQPILSVPPSADSVIACTTPVMPTDTPVTFLVRTVFNVSPARCGTASETAATTLTLLSTGPGAPLCRAWIMVPHAGMRLAGNRMMLMADAACTGCAAPVSVRFQTRAAGGAWADVNPAVPVFDNPDTGASWFVHWDLSALLQGLYEIRAVAVDTAGVADSGPAAITVAIDAAAPDLIHEATAEGIRTRARLAAGAATDVGAAASAGGGPTRIVFPSGAVGTDDTLTVRPLDRSSASNAGFPDGVTAAGEYRALSLTVGTGVFSQSVDLYVGYRDEDGDGYVDGTSVPARDLVAYSRASSSGSWNPLETIGTDTRTREVHARTNHFSEVALGGGEEAPAAAGSKGGLCLLERAAPASWLGAARRLRDRLAASAAGRLVARLYYLL